MNDFFFKTLNVNEKQSSLHLSELRDLTEEFPRYFLKKQINRVLRGLPNHTLIMTCGTSHPDLLSLLELFNTEDIGQIIISYRTDVDSNVKRTLECTLILDEGVINIRPHWCAYKSMRSDEIVTTLLVPILLFGYEKVTYLSHESGVDKVNFRKEDFEVLLMHIFALSGYPLNDQSLEDDRINNWLRYLNAAQEVAATSIPYLERQDRYYKILRGDRVH
ncbi:hypothetical protein A9Q81_00320 [Gammaproteobacteria bacterium 42_54_T18]|nr:hypothetical protein A9Q81_00320 [Gammaproteobacteria bacterium 42_54_T18]